ncbi:MAG: type II toxin-antitoxin system VapC family toxin [Chloroflexi bacterium]|nr:type II toxin-antitoxin system VapC family toxin [Chloroflexota bacterium]
MAFYYFDASALVKRYVSELGSLWVNRIIDEVDADGLNTNHVYLSRVSQTEGAAAFSILERTGRISQRTRDLVYSRLTGELNSLFRIIEVAPATFQQAAELTQRHPLKAYDAVQLAVALEVHNLLNQHSIALTFVSGDSTLLKAAQAEGLATDNPFNHS